MRKIAINDNVYTVMGMYKLSHSDTVRGKLESRIDKDFQDYPITKIEFAVRHGEVGVVMIPSSLEDVVEYTDLVEAEGKILGFVLNGFATRAATAKENEIIASHAGGGFKRRLAI